MRNGRFALNWLADAGILAAAIMLILVTASIGTIIWRLTHTALTNDILDDIEGMASLAYFLSICTTYFLVFVCTVAFWGVGYAVRDVCKKREKIFPLNWLVGAGIFISPVVLKAIFATSVVLMGYL